jgi:hypothetical protein
MTHTPGPWTTRDRVISNRLVMMSNDCVEVVNENGSGVAYLYKENFGQNGMDAANARLIAAAPELLEALYAALPALESIHENGAPILDKVYAAIAKAEGDK